MRVPMTKEGEVALREELTRLKHDRHSISAAIASARALGDLKENSEYHAAREQQALGEAKIRDIEAKLAHAQVIDVATLPRNGKVLFGVWVGIKQLDNNESTVVRIVGADETDHKIGWVSINSPIAQALLGGEEGEVMTVDRPDGSQVKYEILNIDYQAPKS